MAHLVMCPRLDELHKNLESTYRDRGKTLPDEGWSRVFTILKADCDMIVERIEYCAKLESRLLTIGKKNRIAKRNPNVREKH